MSRQPRLRSILVDALGQTAVRPHVLLVLLLANLLVSWIVVAPLRGVLAAELDDNLYGDTMSQGISWRWFDTVQRRHPQTLGDLGAWTDLFTDDGATFQAIRSLSGPPLALLLAGLLLFWLNGMLHCGFLAHLYPDRKGGLAAATVRFAPPATFLAILALLLYWGIYRLFYVQTGIWLDDLRADASSEGVALAMTWSRLLLTLLGIFMVKLIYDLSRVVLVDRGSWNWPWAVTLAMTEVLRRGWRYAAAYAALGSVSVALLALWGWLGGAFTAGGWVGLAVVFVLQQLFLAARMGLRLAHLAAARGLYRGARRAVTEPPFKVERE